MSTTWAIDRPPAPFRRARIRSQRSPSENLYSAAERIRLNVWRAIRRFVVAASSRCEFASVVPVNRMGIQTINAGRELLLNVFDLAPLTSESCVLWSAGPDVT